MRFRKQPVEIDAIRVADALALAASNWAGLPKWLSDAYESVDVIFLANQILIRTLEGWMTGHRDWWIIRGVKGELYPCRGDIFAESYETVE